MLQRLSDKGAIRYEPDTPGNGIPYGNGIAPALPKEQLPEVQYGGPFGWFPDPQSSRHRRAVIEIRQIAEEIGYAEANGLALEVRGLYETKQSGQRAEAIVASAQPGSATRALAADQAGDMFDRVRPRRSRFADLFDAEVMNLIPRK